MAKNLVGLASEERRRQYTLLAMGAGLFALTLPVNNQRALFSPLGDVPILGELSPVAYAMVTGGPGASGGGAPGGQGRSAAGPAARDLGDAQRAPGAFVARIPGESPAAPADSTTPAETAPTQFAALDPNAGGGSGVPGSIGEGGTGGGGGIGNPGVGGGDTGGSPAAGGGLPGIGDIPGIGGTPNPTGAVPEPATWLTMILGFGVIGTIMRRARRRRVSAPPVAGISAG